MEASKALKALRPEELEAEPGVERLFYIHILPGFSLKYQNLLLLSH